MRYRSGVEPLVGNPETRVRFPPTPHRTHLLSIRSACSPDRRRVGETRLTFGNRVGAYLSFVPARWTFSSASKSAGLKTQRSQGQFLQGPRGVPPKGCYKLSVRHQRWQAARNSLPPGPLAQKQSTWLLTRGSRWQNSRGPQCGSVNDRGHAAAEVQANRWRMRKIREVRGKTPRLASFQPGRVTMDVRATTESGTTYTFRDGLVRIQPADRRATPTTINIITMKSFKTDEGAHLTLSNLMEFLHDKPEIDRPVVGEHLFVSGFKNWRISTPIKTVEEL